MEVMRITYYSGLYEHELTDNVHGDIKFVEQNGVQGVLYATMGHKKFVAVKNVKKIEKTIVG